MSAFETFPVYRSRYLPALRLEQIHTLPHKAGIPVVLPIGAVEQHGPHLPLGVDAMMGQAWLNAALPHLGEKTPCLIAPPITVGKSNEHLGFPGTLSIGRDVLAEMVWAMARQLHAWDFRLVAVLNTHGGNSPTVRATLREIHAELGLLTCMIRPPYPSSIEAQEVRFGFHAGQVETAWMLAVAPELVDREAAICEYPARLGDPGELRPEDASAVFSWVTSDLSGSGVIGDATRATAEDGLAWLKAGGHSLAQLLTGLAGLLAR